MLRHGFMPRRWWAVGVLVVPVLLMVACDGSPPATQRQPQTRPVMPETAPVEEPASVPVETQPVDPELPEYLAVSGRFDARAAIGVQVMKAEGHRVALETQNVQRLHIDRGRLPVRQDRSIALILDGQGIEWLASSPVTEFERSENGVWAPVKPVRTEEAETRPVESQPADGEATGEAEQPTKP